MRDVNIYFEQNIDARQNRLNRPTLVGALVGIFYSGLSLRLNLLLVPVPAPNYKQHI
jgi:hypothetical protein